MVFKRLKVEKDMRMTLKKIGELAGVSTACVSNVLNGKSDSYSKETVERVKKIADEYNYRPNAIAKSMKTKTTNTLGLVIPDISDPFFPEVAKGIGDCADQLGYSILILNTDGNPEREKKAFRTLCRSMVDGVLLIPSVSTLENEDVIESFPAPVILVDWDYDIKGIRGIVVNDDYRGSEMATRFLLENGHRNILFVSGNSYQNVQGHRARAFLDVMEDNGLTVGEDYIQFGTYSHEFGYQAVTDFLAKNLPLDAVYASCDNIAMGVMHALRDHNLRIPDDISVIGYDDTHLSRYSFPPLTTICQSKYEIGRQAVRLIIDLIHNDKAEYKKIVSSPELVIRSSVKPKNG